jgi:hypothetical protein
MQADKIVSGHESFVASTEAKQPRASRLDRRTVLKTAAASAVLVAPASARPGERPSGRCGAKMARHDG